MKFWQKHRRHTSLLILGLVLILALGCVSVEAAPNWKLSDYRMIKDGDIEYFVGGDTLYKRVNGKDTVITKWNLTGNDYLAIISGYKNNINISVVHQEPYGKIYDELYVVNYKTGKKVKAITPLRPLGASGPYIYGQVVGNNDSYLQPVYIWKASGNKMKRTGKLCLFLSGSMSVVNKKIYFGINPGANKSVLEVYKCNLNGKGRKKLFTLKSPGGEIFVTDNRDGIISILEEKDSSKIEYKYNIKTGKLSKVS